MSARFDGQVIVVTGGAPGIGAVIVERAVAEGARGMLAEIPMGHLASTADIAAAVLFLASADAGYITGQTLMVDGGWSILGMRHRPDWLRSAPRGD